MMTVKIDDFVAALRSLKIHLKRRWKRATCLIDAIFSTNRVLTLLSRGQDYI